MIPFVVINFAFLYVLYHLVCRIRLRRTVNMIKYSTAAKRHPPLLNYGARESTFLLIEEASPFNHSNTLGCLLKKGFVLVHTNVFSFWISIVGSVLRHRD